MHYVVVGNAVAGITAAFTLRQQDRNAGITVICGEGDCFVSRTALMYPFMDCLKLRDLEQIERSAYEEQKITLTRRGSRGRGSFRFPAIPGRVREVDAFHAADSGRRWRVDRSGVGRMPVASSIRSPGLGIALPDAGCAKWLAAFGGLA